MNKRLGLVIDQERCIGCDCCTVACRLENESSQGFIKVGMQDGGPKDVPVGVFPDLKLVFVARTCNHCNNPPCLESCSANAINKRDDGIVLIDQEQCTGCQVCVDACPYNIIYFNQETNIVEKCNLCAQRIDQGLEPFCVICCEGQAIHFGDLNDSDSQIAQLISKRDTFQLKPGAKTNPSIYYCLPKPRKRL